MFGSNERSGEIAFWRRLVGRLKTSLSDDSYELAFVALVWFTQTWLLVRFVNKFTLNIPFADEWELVPALTGHAKVSLSWLWSLHNEHRIPLPRLVYLAIAKLSSNDFRAGCYFDVVLLSLLSLGCTAAARRVRGRTSYSDAFFPLLLLHWGQAENLVWSFQIAFILSSALVLVPLMLITAPGMLSARAALGLGGCTLALPLAGGATLAFVPAFAGCTLLSGWQLRRAGVRGAAAVLALGGLSLVLLALYFVGYHRPPYHPTSPTLSVTARSTLQFLVLGLGSGTKPFWAYAGSLVVVLLAATVACLLWLLIRRPDERSRVVRLGLFFGGMLCLAGGIGWARSAVYPAGIFASRYVTLALPVFCAMYLSAVLIPSTKLSLFAQMFLFLIAAVLVSRNREDGQLEGSSLYGGRHAVLTDIRAGMPSSTIAQNHCWFLYLCDEDTLLQRMRMLRDAKIGEFKVLRD